RNSPAFSICCARRRRARGIEGCCEPGVRPVRGTGGRLSLARVRVVAPPGGIDPMQARARLLGHPVHQSLVAFPLGGLGAGILFDIVGLVSGGGRWHDVAYWVMLFGIITGLIAAVFG